jgi:hypothetical protein
MEAVDLLCSRNAHAGFNWMLINAGGARWTRAVGDQSAPIPQEISSELGGTIMYGRCSLDGRSRTSTGVIPLK